MGSCERSAEPACSSPIMLVPDCVEELGGSSLGERLGEWVVEPFSSLDIGALGSPRGGKDCSVLEKHCCSVSDHGLGVLEAEDGSATVTCALPASGDANCEVADGRADVRPEVENAQSIELGFGRLGFDETESKMEMSLCSSGRVDLSEEGQGPLKVQQVGPVSNDNLSEGSGMTIVSCSTVDRAVNDGSVKGLGLPAESSLNDVVGAISFVNVAERLDLVEKEGKDNARTDDDMRDVKCPEVPSLPLRRSSRSRKPVQTTEGGKRATKHSKKGANLSISGFIDLLSKTARKKRSCSSRSLCASGWGLSGNLSKYFEWGDEVTVNNIVDKESVKGRAVKVVTRKKKPKAVTNTQLSEEGRRAPCRPIRLKVTFGKKEEQNKVECMRLDSLSGVQLGADGNHLSLCSSMERKGGNVTDDSVNVDMPLLQRFSSVDNVEFAGTGSEKCSTSGKSTPTDSALLSEQLCSLSADKYLDPGTSPDSEIIDEVLDSTTGSRTSNHNPVSITSVSDVTADPGNVSFSLVSRTAKKKKNNGVLCQAENSGMEDKLQHQVTSDKAKVPKKGGQRQKAKNGRSRAVVTCPSDYPSSNTSGSELIQMEVFPICEEGPHNRAQSLDNGSDSNLCSRTDVRIKLAGNSSQLLPAGGTQTKRNSKCSTAKGKSRNKSKVTDATRRQRRISGNTKVNNRKLASKCNVNKNDIMDEAQKEGQLEIGNNAVVDMCKADTSNEVHKSASCSEVKPTVVGEQTLPPRLAWVCCDDCNKWRCIPAELADVIERTNSKWTCKDNKDQAFADCSIPQEKSNADINAELQISDEEDAREGYLGSKDSGFNSAVDSQQSTWMLIKYNLFLHRSRKTQTLDEIMVCHCKPPAAGSRGCGGQCLNRMLNIECVEGTCPCGDLCSNQRFQKQQYAKLNWFRCGKKGYGLQVQEDISEGQFLIEYVGEVLDLQSYEARQKDYASKGHKHFYFMTLNGNEVIDACSKGNLGRFVNHSCDPNCRTEKWVVNGEICVGLFALRNIRKGEELTFDYNYVRVFGAAAKKCHCGSLKCRGYIGGDPLNSEVIVQGDSDEEFPEPVVIYENGGVDNDVEDILSRTRSVDDEPVPGTDNINEEKLEVKLEDEEMVDKSEESLIDVGRQSPIVLKKEIIDEVSESSDDLAALQPEDEKNILLPAAEKLSPITEQTTNTSMSLPVSDTLPVKSMVNKSLSGSIDSSSRLSEVDTVECEQPPPKSRPRMKISRPSKSIKNRKSNSNSACAEKATVMAHRSQVLAYKPKKLLEGSAYCHLKAVEEKLNELLDTDGGICKRKDASKGYLKLLLLTAASGDSGNGGAIQSNRGLSMILDAILKTKSRGVLLDIISKNGLQMLHNMMKLYRKDFKKIPILRKLLKVFEFLAEREILTLERINGDPLRPGVESFKESILSFTEHEDKKVHQFARNFRDRWIPRSMRKFNGIEKVDRNREFNRVSNHSRCSGTHHHWRDPGAGPTEERDCVKPLAVLNSPSDTKMQGPPPQLIDSQTLLNRPRKRKSRWDQDKPPSPRKKTSPKAEISEGKLSQRIDCSCSAQNSIELNGMFSDVVMQNSENDAAPPGFSPPNHEEDAPPGFSSMPTKSQDAPPGFAASLSPQNSIPLKCSSLFSIGQVQERFNPRLPVSYGVPFSIIEQCGTPKSGVVDGWAIAPSMPFLPFPPLPPYPRDRTENGGHEERRQDNCSLVGDQGIASTSGAHLSNVQNPCANNQQMAHQERGFSNGSGRRNYKKRKWNHSDTRAPWLRKRWGFKGNHPRNGAFDLSMDSMAHDQSCQQFADVNYSVDCAGNSC